ncbi:MAG TPA: TonB-dependent receptor, partial [Flavobacteriales bacterium]|nr:TonB-dependent receptor [Flavobacteriales bacterium]
DIESIKTKQNAGSVTYTASGKIDIRTSETINLTVGGSLDFNNRQNWNRNNSLLNADNNYRTIESSWRSFVKFTQRFLDRTAAEEKKSTIKNAFYSLQLDFSRYNLRVQDYDLADNFWNYGYVGRFDRYRAPQFQLQGTRWVQTGDRDTLVTFAPGSQNPDLAALDQFYFNALPREAFPLPLLFGANVQGGDYIGYYQDLPALQQRRVLLNGDRPQSLYDMWNNIGYIDDPDGAEYRLRRNDQIRFTATGSADIGQHAVSIGMEYEQTTQRRYDFAPIGLWTKARLLANSHLANYVSDPDSAYNVIDPSQSSFPLYYMHPRVGTDQNFFDRSLRTSLGLDPNGTDYINVDALSPDVFRLDMFSPDQLIQSGQGIMGSYAGYDYLGNVLKRKPSFDDFFDAKDGRGVNTRAQAPFQPIYMAGYVMDKFAFDDLIFNVGVRVDRYDANQVMLKDKYLLAEAYKAGDAVPNSAIAEDLANRPSNIGNDYVVYVDDTDNPHVIKGYRDGDTWYNDAGVELSDGNALQNGGQVRPYLVGGEQRTNSLNSPLSKGAFTDYVPVVNVMPRVAFSFPISDEAVFFAHYDVLTQRPDATRSRIDLLDLAYIENSDVNTIVANAALKPTKTIDYELGFQQVLSKSSSLKIAAFYRELRNQITVRNVSNAWPRSYKTFDNFDFGTVKGFTTTFDLRQTGNVWMRAAYTLQFADGTGSTVTSGVTLINSGQPNLRNISPLNFDQRHRFQVTFDFRYGGGKDYNGPMLWGKPILQRTGVNIV